MTISYELQDALSNIEDEYPYYIPFITYCRFVESKDVPTFAINASLKVMYNENFISDLTTQQLEFVLLHEFMHVAHNHPERGKRYKNKIPFDIINIAADLEINSVLLSKTSLTPPLCCVEPGRFGFPMNKSMEEYIDLLLKENSSDQQKGRGQENIGTDNNSDSEPDENQDNQGQESPSLSDKLSKSTKNMSSDLKIDDDNSASSGTEITEEELQGLLEQCEKTAEARGNSSLMGPKSVIKVKKRVYNWAEVLKNIITDVSTIVRGDELFTYHSLSRRSSNTDIILPSYYTYEVFMKIIVIFDISGSMFEWKEKVYGLLRSLKDSIEGEFDITILETDTEVLNVIHDFDVDSEQVQTVDGGGTDLRTAWTYIIDHHMDTDANLILCMTDGYTPWPDPPVLKDKTIVLTTHLECDNGYTCYKVTFD